jgi:hypothetical protein
MTKRTLITLCTTLLLAACGGDKPAEDKKATDKKGDDAKKADDTKKAEGDVAAPEPTPTPEPAPANKIDIKTLKLDAPGWDGQFAEAIETWTFTKDSNEFYIDYIDSERPADVEGYAKKLQEDQNFQDLGYLYTAVDKKEAFDKGWVITGTAKDMGDDEDKGHPAFVIYRTDKGVYCRSGEFEDTKAFEEAIELCKKL